MRVVLGFVLLAVASLFVVPESSAGEFTEQRAAQPRGQTLAARTRSLLLRWFCKPDGRLLPQWTEHELSEGDLVFFRTKDETWRSIFASFGSPGPTHIGMVVRHDDGELGLLHALDPNLKIKSVMQSLRGVRPGEVCWTPNVSDYLREYDGDICVRPYRGAFPAESSRRLTAWAKRQIGKPYGLHKLPLPPLGLPIQSLHWGGPAQVEGDSWFCSELVASALVVTGHLSPWNVRPVRTDPEDLFTDRWLNLRRCWEPPLLWSASPPVDADATVSDATLADPTADRSPRPATTSDVPPTRTQPQRVASVQHVRFTIQNRTTETYRLWIGDQFLGELPSQHEITALGPTGPIEVIAQTVGNRSQTRRLKTTVATDTTWSLTE